MKKFLRSRSDYTETTSASNNMSLESVPQLTVDAAHYERKPVAVQPPLPPYPPPPDSPTITIKQEKEDTPCDDSNDSVNQEPVQMAPVQSEERPKRTMCKEFIRGDCKRPMCRFLHEIDIKQLRGVFTFCWQYQNAVCSYPNCKFVHASVFEEAEFYRTGILPAHARAHLKKPQPPPPPPEESTSNNTSNRTNTPSAHPHSGNMEARTDEDFRAVARTSSPLKREWIEIDDFSSSPCDLEPKEPLAKKCKNCEIMDFRLEYHREKVKSIKQSKEEFEKKAIHLSKRNQKLTLVLLTVMKPMNNAKTSVPSGLLTGDEKSETTNFRDQLNFYSSTTNNRQSLLTDHLKNLLGGNNNITNLLAKMLYSNGDLMPSDNSRET